MSVTERPPAGGEGEGSGTVVEEVSAAPKSGFGKAFSSNRTQKLILPVAFFAIAAALPFVLGAEFAYWQDATQAAVYVMMALGLNIIVGYAGLLDLGYVAFFAIGALTIGWFGSDLFGNAGGGEGIHVLVSDFVQNLSGIHLNFLIILVLAVVATTIAGMIIGLPTLRLRGDYIAIVTLAFGEIIGDLVENGDRLSVSGYALSNGKQGIQPIDKIQFPGFDQFPAASIDGRPWFWTALALVALVLFVNFRLRDSRLGRAWIALREDEVAAASMGVPLVKTKLLAYGTGAAFGGLAGAFYSSFLSVVNSDQFQFQFSILILSMVILGGLGSIWGVILGAIALSLINFRLIPEARDLPEQLLGLEGFQLTDLNFFIFGFLLLMMMILRPEGLLPERRRQIEMTDEAHTAGDALAVKS